MYGESVTPPERRGIRETEPQRQHGAGPARPGQPPPLPAATGPARPPPPCPRLPVLARHGSARPDLARSRRAPLARSPRPPWLRPPPLARPPWLRPPATRSVRLHHARASLHLRLGCTRSCRSHRVAPRTLPARAGSDAIGCTRARLLQPSRFSESSARHE
nr:uncharacterized protein LOC127315645 [Lolium perenne]